jgi:hypothetical protein
MAARPRRSHVSIGLIMKRLLAGVLILILTVAGCTTSPQYQRDDSCKSGSVLLDAHFDGGQLGQCVISKEGEFELTLFPEDEPPINKSPWFAYRISGRPGDHVSVRMQFHNGYARYWPKISVDGTNWVPVSEDQVVKSDDGQMEL